MTEQHEKIANELEKALNQFSENVNKILEEMFSFESKTEKDWEMKCPYKDGDEYYYVYGDGCVRIESWDNFSMEISRWKSGNIFKTQQEAELEAERRKLLTRFRAFRNECNGDWNADWMDATNKQHYLSYSRIKNGMYVSYVVLGNHLHTFGYFKNEKDAEHAIELFGDEIKKLFIDCECD